MPGDHAGRAWGDPVSRSLRVDGVRKGDAMSARRVPSANEQRAAKARRDWAAKTCDEIEALPPGTCEECHETKAKAPPGSVVFTYCPRCRPDLAKR